MSYLIMGYYVKSVSPKYSKGDNKLLGYTLTYANDANSYTDSDFFSVEDMKTLNGCASERECLDLKGKECELIKTYNIIKNK